jgi:hypothetical protein
MRAGLLVIALAMLGMTAGAEPPARSVRQLAWLQGCWEAASAERTVEEQWMAPRGNSMVGSSRTVRRGTLAGYELVVILERDDRLVYLAHPSGQPSAEFVSTMVTEQSVIFEDPEHDFPQRIGYLRRGSELLAWIEGSDRGEIRRIEFPYTRARCPGD